MYPDSWSAQSCPVQRQGNPSILRQISESVGGLLDNPSQAEERGGGTYQTVQRSGGTWISISHTGNDSGIAGGRVSIQRTTGEALKDTSWFGDRNTLVAPGVYENKSGGVL